MVSHVRWGVNLSEGQIDFQSPVEFIAIVHTLLPSNLPNREENRRISAFVDWSFCLTTVKLTF